MPCFTRTCIYVYLFSPLLYCKFCRTVWTPGVSEACSVAFKFCPFGVLSISPIVHIRWAWKYVMTYHPSGIQIRKICMRHH